MPDPGALGLVAGAAVLLWVLPGPALLLLLVRGLDLGARGAVATALGLGLGTTVHVLAAAVGLSALLATSATAFTVVKGLGGAYLVWLGVRRWRDPTPLLPDHLEGAVVRTPHQALLEGFAINALNPKVAVFFLAFLPPFVEPQRGAVLAQTVVLGLVVVLVLLVGDALFALLTGSVGRAWVRSVRTPRRDEAGRRAVAGVYVGLGALTLAAGRST